MPGRAAPPNDLRRDVARAWRYMVAEHGVTVDDALLDVVRAWHAADAPDDWERTRGDASQRSTANPNRHVSTQ